MKAQENLSIYEYEKNKLGELQQQKDSLESEYEFYTSTESKILLAREILNLGREQDRLYQTKEQPVYYKLKVEYIDVKEKEDYRDWWEKILFL